MSEDAGDPLEGALMSDTVVRSEHALVDNDAVLGLFGKIPLEIFQEIVTNLSTHDAFLLGCTRRAILDMVVEISEHNIVKTITPFAVDYNGLFSILHEFDCVVTGSVALRVQFLSKNRYSFSPNSLDICAPSGKGHAVVQALVDKFGHSSARSLHWKGMPCVSESFVLDHWRSPNRSINVFVSVTDSSLCPIFASPTTTSMNFVSSKMMFCGYPRLTLNGLFKVNSSLTLPAVNRQQLIWDETGEYLTRGFLDIDTTNIQPRHVCTEDPICPLTRRHVDDQHCIYFPLSNRTWLTDEQVDNSGNHPFCNNLSFAWKIGGRACYNAVRAEEYEPYIFMSLYD